MSSASLSRNRRARVVRPHAAVSPTRPSVGGRLSHSAFRVELHDREAERLQRCAGDRGVGHRHDGEPIGSEQSFDELVQGIAIDRPQQLELLRAEGKAVILTTHHLDDAERLGTRFGLLHHGRLVIEGTLADLRARTDCTSLIDIFLKMSSVGRALVKDEG